MKSSRYNCSTETQKKLINAVIALTRTKSFESITVQEICSAAGVSTGSFYHQFGSRDGMVMAAYQNIDWLLTDSFREQYRNLSPLAALNCLLIRYLEYVQQEIGPVLGQYYKVLLNHPGVTRYDMTRPYCQEIRRLLELASAQNLLHPDCDLDSLTRAFMRLLRGLLFDWVIEGCSYDLLSRYRLDFSIFLRGLAPESALDKLNVFSAS